MSHYNSVDEVFSILNSAGIQYLVLRNYENLSKPEVFLDGHADIDILCKDSQEIVQVLDVQTNRKDEPPFVGDGTHYYIYVGGEKVSLDLRYVGDGYYCEKWQTDMLTQRVFNGLVFVLDPENYFYSLIYHAILQKREFSDEYKRRLKEMAGTLGITVNAPSEYSFLQNLQDYMRMKGYCFTYSKDYTVPCRFRLVDKKMIRRNSHLRYIHWRFETKVSLIAFLVRIKHFIVGVGKS